MLKKELIDIICCPVDHGDLEYNVEQNTLTCKKCNRVYEVKDDIPILIVEENG